MASGYFRPLKTMFQNMLDAYHDDYEDEQSLQEAGITLGENAQAISISSLSMALYQMGLITQVPELTRSFSFQEAPRPR
jgi:hypothetical protein